MTELLKLLLSKPFPISLIIVGLLLTASLAFEEYLGLKPRKETRKITGFLGIIILVSGVLFIFIGGGHRVAPTNSEEMDKTGTHQPSNASDICERYGHYTAKEWRDMFFHDRQKSTWHVIVASLDSSEEEAKDEVERYRHRFPNHDFNVIPNSFRGQGIDFRYAIVIATGIRDAVIAQEIAKYARDCGISPSAYEYQQNI